MPPNLLAHYFYLWELTAVRQAIETAWIPVSVRRTFVEVPDMRQKPVAAGSPTGFWRMYSGPARRGPRLRGQRHATGTSACRRSEQPPRQGAIDRSAGDGVAVAAARSP